MKDDVLELTDDIKSGVCKVFAKGRIDSNTADSLLSKLENIIKDGHMTIVLNMSRIEYLSSIGIRVILKTYKQVSEMGGKFNIEKPSEIVKNVLGMLALKEMLVSD